MEKIWFILINDKKEGPYSFLELKQDDRITPDTLAWREGFAKWLPIRAIPELRDLFKDEETQKEPEKIVFSPTPENEVISLRKDPPSFNIWILMAVLIILYFFYLLFK